MWLRAENDGSVLCVRVRPNAAKDAVEGLREDRLVIRLNAPAVEGKANKALIRFLSDRLDIAKSRIAIRTGEKGRAKVLVVTGLAPDEVRNRLGLADPPSEAHR